MNRVKNVLLIGAARSGKSIFSEKMSKEMGYTHIIMDSIIETFYETFPEIGIKHDESNNPVFNKFLKSYLKNLFKYGFNNIIDMEILSPEVVSEIIDKDETEVIYFGYPSISVEDKFVQIRKHDTEFDWTINLNDIELKELIIKKIELSKQVQKEANKYDITYIDTSYNREITFDNMIKQFKYENLLNRSHESFNKYKR